MKYRNLGKLKVSAIGMGCMGFSHGYGRAPEKSEAIKLMQEAFDRGCTFYDTAEGYLHGENEKLVGEALKPIRGKVVLATKFHLDDSEAGSDLKAAVRSHLQRSLARLGCDHVELYYYHRVNPKFELAQVAEAVAPLIKEGLIGGWGLSQVTPAEIRLAHKFCPLTAVQSEYSIVERLFEKDVVPLCESLGIGFVPFSPMGQGFLSGAYAPGGTYTGDDVRRAITRFKDENMQKNLPLLSLMQEYAGRYGMTLAQFALCWILKMSPVHVPIPGMRTLSRIEENLGAAGFEITNEDLKEFNQKLAGLTLYGNRTDEDIMAMYRQDDLAKPGAVLD